MSVRWIFEYLSLWQLFTTSIGVNIVALEIGFRLGKRRRVHRAAENDTTVSASVGATLGLIGYMLAMTFGVAIAQFDTRRQSLIEEVNAISTAYLRADLLPIDLRDESRRILQEYVQVRLFAVDSGNVREASIRSQDLHRQLWSTVILAHDEVSNVVSFGLYAQAVGDILDAHTRRIVSALQARIPAVIWAVLFSIAAVGMGEMGYQAGVVGSNRSPTHVVLAVSLAAVLWLVADLDRPREGAIRVSQKSMRDLERSMKGGAAGTSGSEGIHPR